MGEREKGVLMLKIIDLVFFGIHRLILLVFKLYIQCQEKWQSHVDSSESNVVKTQKPLSKIPKVIGVTFDSLGAQELDLLIQVCFELGIQRLTFFGPLSGANRQALLRHEGAVVKKQSDSFIEAVISLNVSILTIVWGNYQYGQDYLVECITSNSPQNEQLTIETLKKRLEPFYALDLVICIDQEADVGKVDLTKIIPTILGFAQIFTTPCICPAELKRCFELYANCKQNYGK